MIKCIVHRIKNIFSFSEKAGRLDFTITTLSLVIFVAIGNFIYGIFFPWNGFPFLLQLIFFFGVLLLIANICRRLNDLERSRWSILIILFVPIANILFLLAHIPSRIGETTYDIMGARIQWLVGPILDIQSKDSPVLIQL